MKKYINAEVSFVKFSNEDIICVSGPVEASVNTFNDDLQNLGVTKWDDNAPTFNQGAVFFID